MSGYAMCSREYRRIHTSKSTSYFLTFGSIARGSLPGGYEEWAEIEDYQLWVKEILPRLVVNPFIVALWALFESTVTEVASLIQKKKGVALGLADIKGKHFRSRIEKYYIHVLEFSFDISDKTSQVDLLGAIRNAIVHSNGRVEGLSKTNTELINGDKVEGVSESSYGGYLIIDLRYAKKSFELVEEYLRLLFDNYGALRKKRE